MSYLCPYCHTNHDTTACPVNFGTPVPRPCRSADDLDAKLAQLGKRLDALEGRPVRVVEEMKKMADQELVELQRIRIAVEAARCANEKPAVQKPAETDDDERDAQAKEIFADVLEGCDATSADDNAVISYRIEYVRDLCKARLASQREIADLRTLLETCEKIKDEELGLRVDAEDKIKSLKTLLEQAQKEIADLKRERDGDAESARMMQERLTRMVEGDKDLKAQLDKVVGELNETREVKYYLEDTVKNIKAQLDTAARARGAYLEQLRDASVELGEAQKQTADLQAENQQLGMAYQKLIEIRADGLTESGLEKFKKQKKEIADLKAQLAEIERAAHENLSENTDNLTVPLAVDCAQQRARAEKAEAQLKKAREVVRRAKESGFSYSHLCDSLDEALAAKKPAEQKERK